MGQLLKAGEAVFLGIEAGLEQPQREWGEVTHLPAPGDGFPLELVHRNDRVDEAHFQRLFRGVVATQEPELLGFLDTDVPGQQAGAEAAVEAAHARARLPEAAVVG